MQLELQQISLLFDICNAAGVIFLVLGTGCRSHLFHTIIPQTLLRIFQQFKECSTTKYGPVQYHLNVSDLKLNQCSISASAQLKQPVVT